MTLSACKQMNSGLLKMNKIKHLLLTLFILSAPGLATADTLLEIYQQALQSDPLIHEAEARRLAALEAVPQARSALLPQLSAGASLSSSSSDGSNLQTRGIDSYEADSRNWNLSLSQTVFRWDQMVGLQQAHKVVAKAEAVREAAQQDLILRVANRYVAVLAAEDSLTSINADRLAIARQLEQAKQRFEVGLIAITDVQESQAAYDQAVASEIGAKRSLATAREYLREITGQYATSLSAPVEDFPLPAPNPESEAAWVDQAMNQNLNVVASRLDEELARGEVGFRRTGHYPTLELTARRSNANDDITANLSPIAGQPNPPPESFTQEQTSDSINLQLTVPLFSGGRTSSRVREAVHLHRASKEQLQRIARETERETRDAYLGVISEISRVKALKQAVASSRTALQATEAGFEVGTRTIVDVLVSQRAVYNAITNYYSSRYNYLLNVLKLKKAAGTLQVQDLESIDTWLESRVPAEEKIRNPSS
jgi:outer membrane protein